ncbi:hypothetical protein MESS2_1100029 [Mesorhizobium metallidurans STM 2683]|uniref:Uncharacterized protein n=1 Tax=Mesorhizobium metallidurans STM 2683 TaxID=1297569 RepID=M5EGH7_9HYPH|nr:hypothetical protein MESS2_1100029 [Mesorhizobium metallidurans STM 2683]
MQNVPGRSLVGALSCQRRGNWLDAFPSGGADRDERRFASRASEAGKNDATIGLRGGEQGHCF